MRREGATGRSSPNASDLAVARIAARQHGVIGVVELCGAGLDDSAIRRRVRTGRLHRLHRGVYAVGHTALNWRGRWLAAVLAVGDGAVLSHHSAAALWGLIRPIRGPIEVTVRGNGGRRRRDEIRVHRSRALDSASITRRHGIRVTTPARTIADLRGTVPQYLYRRAVRQAELAGHRLGAGVSVKRTRSDLELDFLALCARHRLPAPEVNVRVGRWTVDFLWRDQYIAVETDFFDYHRGSIAFEDDHQRDLDLRGQGYDVRRYTGAQIRNHPAQVVADLGEVLRLRAS